MAFEAILNEVDQLHNVSTRLEGLAEQHTPITEALMTIAGSVRNTATLLAVLVATKFPILPGTVQKIIKSPFPSEPEKAQISVEGADHLYREIRIDNTLTNEKGEEVSLKPGAQVEVTVEADAKDTTPKK